MLTNETIISGKISFFATSAPGKIDYDKHPLQYVKVSVHKHFGTCRSCSSVLFNGMNICLWYHITTLFDAILSS